MKWKDHYKTLHISPDSNITEIKKAYRQLAHKYHPDKNTTQNKKVAENLFLQITEAYKVLLNPLLRREYDEVHRKHQKKSQANSSQAKPKPSEKKRTKVKKDDKENSSFQDLIKNVFVNNIEEETITQTQQTETKVTKNFERGRHLKYQLNLTYEDICDGCEKIITFIRKRKSKNESAKLKIKVPSGITRGKQLRLKKEGDEGEKDYGDLLVVINVLQHQLFRKENLNAHLDLPITYQQAVMGDKVLIPTLRRVHRLTIPSGTTPGTVLSINGEGFRSSNNSIGNLIVNIQIDVPKNLSSVSKQKLKEFNETIKHKLSIPFQNILAERVKNNYT